MTDKRFSNEAVAKILREVVAAMQIKNEDQFRRRAYENAAASVEHATEEVRDLWEEGRLKELPGVGEALTSHLQELFEKGRVAHFEAEKQGLPPSLFELLGIPGVGAKTAYVLAKELKLKPKQAVSQLAQALKEGRVRKIPGFGETSESSLLENLTKTRKEERRLGLLQADELAGKMIRYLQQCPPVVRVDGLGSLRRRSATVGDIDLAVATDDPAAVVRYFTKFPEAAEVLNEGGIKGRIILKNGRQIDLMTQKPEAYGALLQHFTGSKNHNIHLREVALKQGLSLSEYGIRNRSGKTEVFADEPEFYRRLGLDFIPPELREDRGEIELSRRGQLPRLIEREDLRGDLQTHTVWSDGENSLAEMVKSGQEMGYAYLGISDHPLSLERHGYDYVLKEIRRRRKEIEYINCSDGKIRVLNGIEILIKVDGDLSYPDSLLAEFDYVLAAIHTGFDQELCDLTRRYVNALKNKFVKILAHPTGRLLGKREEMEADWEEVFKVSAALGKIVEIDGYPDRLDLPDRLVATAKSFGVKFAVDSDAHRCQHLPLIDYGVSVARRGGLTKADVINTLPLERLKKVLAIK